MMHTHGGNWAAFEAEHGQPPLDFSANVSPLGLPDGVRAAVIRSLEHADRYPDPDCRALRDALAANIGIPAENILCGNGAADLIERFTQAVQPKTALITAPTFSEYAASLKRGGCEVYEHLLRQENDFHLTESILSQITPDTDLVILCEPNNPTGALTELSLLGRILARCRVCGALLMVDACFQDFTGPEKIVWLLQQLPEGGLLILRAFTKFYGMAGLRLGYCLCADTALLRRMKLCGQPWPVSGPAQAAGIAALKETDYARRLKALIAEQRPWLTNELRSLGFSVWEGEANYLLFYADDRMLSQKLEREGILIRACDNYHGLGPGWYRAAVRTPEENRQLVAAIRKVRE